MFPLQYVPSLILTADCTGLGLIIFSPDELDFDFLTTNMFPLNSGWIALDRCVMCHKRKATLLLDCKTSDITQGKLYGEGTKQGWEVNIFDGDPTSLLRQELGSLMH